MDKQTQRKLDLLAALQAGGVENWDGYDFATEEHRKTVRREEVLEDIVGEILDGICDCIEEPSGRGCGYGFKESAYTVATQILLSRAKELCE